MCIEISGWVVDRAPDWGITPTGCAVMVQRVRRLLDDAKEPADTMDWGREFQSLTVLML